MRKWTTALLLVSVLLCSPPAGAEKSREKPKSSGSNLPGIMAARNSPVGRMVLPNGMIVLVTESPSDDIVAAELLVRVGLVEESSPMAGVTNLVQDVLEKRISTNSDGQDAVEITGSLLKCSSEPDYARISLEATSREFPGMLDRVAAAVKKTEFSADEVKEARERVISEIKGDHGAFTQLYEIFRQYFYRYHPYRNNASGSEASVGHMDPTSVQKFYAANYASNRMVLAISGRVNRTEVMELVRRDFGGLKPVESHTLEIPWEPKATEKEIFLSANSEIAWVFVGYPAPGVGSRDYVAMTLVHAVMGDGLSSRLFTEIREKRGLAYELGAMYPTLLGPSHMLTYTITKPDQANAARRQIFSEMERLKEHGVGEAELAACRRKVIGNYLLERETNSGRAFHLALAEAVGVGYEWDVNFIKEVQSVTPADVQKVARRYLDNYTLVVARPGGRFYFDF